MEKKTVEQLEYELIEARHQSEVRLTEARRRWEQELAADIGKLQDLLHASVPIYDDEVIDESAALLMEFSVIRNHAATLLHQFVLRANAKAQKLVQQRIKVALANNK